MWRDGRKAVRRRTIPPSWCVNLACRATSERNTSNAMQSGVRKTMSKCCMLIVRQVRNRANREYTTKAAYVVLSLCFDFGEGQLLDQVHNVFKLKGIWCLVGSVSRSDSGVTPFRVGTVQMACHRGPGSQTSPIVP